VRVAPLSELSIPQIAALMAEGRPWLPETSDYWVFRTFLDSTSFVVLLDDVPAGAIVALAHAKEVYVDQVAVHRAFRGRGVVEALFGSVEQRARELGCTRVWLSTDPKNPATKVWPRLGYRELGVEQDFKGPGKHRALFEKLL
jgi:ribosomal protein S18 acetylase RimI-like enzyme